MYKTINGTINSLVVVIVGPRMNWCFLSVCSVTGGELFEDIVAREYYSEADARYSQDVGVLIGSKNVMWKVYCRVCVSLSATASIRSWRASVTSTSMTSCTGT